MKTQRHTVQGGIFLSMILAIAAPAMPTSIYDFVIFSGGAGNKNQNGFETWIGAHTVINGDIGSNEDLFQAGNPEPNWAAQLNGSAYAGGNLTLGQELTVGSSSALREVVANGFAEVRGKAKLWGTLDAQSYQLGQDGGTLAFVSGAITAPSSKTFPAISMPTAKDLSGFTALGGDQTIPGNGGTLALAPNTLTTAYGKVDADNQGETLQLASGDYYIKSLSAKGGFTLQVDLTSGQPLNLYVLDGINLSVQHIKLQVKGAGTGGAYVDISAAPALAGLIYMETQGDFDMNGENLWGGTVYALGNMDIGQYINWYGAAYAYGAFHTMDHGTWNYIPQNVDDPSVPDTGSTIVLLMAGLSSLAILRRKG